MSSSRPAPSKRAGAAAAGAVIDRVPELVSVPDSELRHADARVDGVVTPSPELPIVGMCLVETGTLVELKSAMARLASGGRGRFYLRRPQHKRLLDAGGVYLFAVAEPRPAREPIAMKIVPATIVDDVVGSWRDAGDDRADCAQVRWGRLFDSTEVSR